MEFSEALRCGGYLWDDYGEEFDGDVLPNDWVLCSRGAAPLAKRIILVFDESFLEIGESYRDAANRWGQEAGDSFDVLMVEDALETMEEEKEEDLHGFSSEDEEAQYYEDEAWRDDL